MNCNCDCGIIWPAPENDKVEQSDYDFLKGMGKSFGSQIVDLYSGDDSEEHF